MQDKIKKWLEPRIGLEEIVRTQFREYKTPKGANFWSTLGFVTLVAILIQVITGILLMLYYIPHPSLAFDSVQNITNGIPFGWLVRLTHNIGSNLVVATAMLHLVHVFFRGAFKRPRELTWLTGAVMFILLLSSCISGQLLPWNQAGYWSTTVISSMPSFLPVVGDSIAAFIRGGDTVTALTLGRFFAFHVVILPFFLLFCLALHIFFIRRQGLSPSPEQVPQVLPMAEFHQEQHPDGLPCFPNFSMKRLFMVFLYCATVSLILTFSPNLFMPEGTNLLANPVNTPGLIKPPWYFLAQYQMVKSIPNEFVGIGFQVLVLVVFLFFPFFDAGETERSIKKRPALMTTVIGLLILWAALTLWGMR